MCTCANNQKDQTRKEVFDFIGTKKLDIFSGKNSPKGFGLFLVPAPDKGILEFKTVYVENLTYQETVKRGHHCVAFQWIPKGITAKTKTAGNLKIMSTNDIIRILDCTSSRCKPSGCPMGCWCYSGETGYCHAN